jgi:hypothetical protein
MNDKLWVVEHGSEYAVPTEIEALVAEGLLEDQSWHNEACPSFAKLGGKLRLTVWVEHPDPAKREGPGPRYAVCVTPIDDACEGLLLHTGDDPAAVAALVRQVRAW